MDFMQAMSNIGPMIEEVGTVTADIAISLDRIAVALEGIRVLLADGQNYGYGPDKAISNTTEYVYTPHVCNEGCAEYTADTENP